MEFNVGVSLWPNNFSHFINITEVENYVRFEAILNHWTWDKGRKLNKIELPMVPCSADKFYEPYDPMRKLFLDALPYTHCI